MCMLPNHVVQRQVRRARGGERLQPPRGLWADLHRGGRVPRLRLHRPRSRVGRLAEQHARHHLSAGRNDARR